MPTPQPLLTPADFADTGQWHLKIELSATSLHATLRHAADAAKFAIVADTHWTDPIDDDRALLSLIENAVYNHPALLDDYATEIILYANRATWIPNEILDNDVIEEEAFQNIFPGKDPEVMTERLTDATCVYSLARGLEAFLGRTMPGARIRPHLVPLTEETLAKPGEQLLINLRETGVADLIATRNGKMLLSAIHNFKSPSDMAYIAMLAMQTMTMDTDKTEVEIRNTDGLEQEAQEIRELLGQALGNTTGITEES